MVSILINIMKKTQKQFIAILSLMVLVLVAVSVLGADDYRITWQSVVAILVAGAVGVAVVVLLTRLFLKRKNSEVE